MVTGLEGEGTLGKKLMGRDGNEMWSIIRQPLRVGEKRKAGQTTELLRL